jgi:UDP-GlcNAc:undecaprenyl-phosphate GlcNAc-1-phosphate transferase
MRLLAGVGLGALASILGWLSARDIFSATLFARQNYRGATVPVGAGVLLTVAVLTAEAVLVVVDAIRRHHAIDIGPTILVVVTALGFGLLGLVDDLAATGDERGFVGHIRALAAGRLTTGGLKLIGGGLLALVVCGAARTDGIGPLLIDASLVSLAANLGNLFDRAPGRAIKFGTIALVAVLLMASIADRSQLTGVAMVLGAALGLLLFDLREELMLGDAGSNVIGATVGLALVLTCGLATRVAVLAVVVALNLASERVSFGRVIDDVAALRFVDRLGRRRT